MKTIYNLEEFVYNFMFRPLCATYDERIWQVEFETQKLTTEQYEEYKEIIPSIRKEIYKDCNYIFVIMENSTEFKEAVIDRIKKYKPKLYKHLNPNNKIVIFVKNILNS